MSHKTHSNLTESDIVIGNQTKYNGPKRLRSVADKLGGPEQVVFDRLTSLGYTPWKAAQDLRKYGANYVTRCIDRAKAKKDVKNINRFICSIMGTDLDETETRRQSAPKRTQAAPAAPVTPARPKAAAAPDPAQAAPTHATLLAQIEGYSAADQHRARAAMLADREERVLLQRDPNIAATEMRLTTLIAFEKRLVREKQEFKEVFGDE